MTHRRPDRSDRPMRPAERRIYDGLCAYFAKLSARVHASYIQELTEQTRWQDDGGPSPG